MTVVAALVIYLTGVWYDWTVRDILTTAIPCTLILAAGYICVRQRWDHLTFRRCARLGRQLGRPGDVRDRAVPAADQQGVDGALLADPGDQAGPVGVGQVAVPVQRVGGAEHGPVGWLGPARVVRLPGGHRADLRGGQPGLGREHLHVHAPLVLGTAPRGGTQDEQLAVAQGVTVLVEQPAEGVGVLLVLDRLLDMARSALTATLVSRLVPVMMIWPPLNVILPIPGCEAGATETRMVPSVRSVD